MKIIITGAQGQLGQEFISQLHTKYDLYGFNSTELDITNVDSIYKHMDNIRPDIILNCAAYNLVDEAETNCIEARNIYECGPKNLAEVSSHFGTLMVHFSTDFVFDGKSKEPYLETSPTAPINVYGQTKLAGEKYVQDMCDKHIILRTAWLYGSSKKNFFNSIIHAALKESEINVVEDQTGSPTYLPELVMQLDLMITKGYFGLYHCSGNGFCSKYEFANEILNSMKLETKINPVKTIDYPHKANRPEFSALNNSLIEGCTNRKIRHWKDSLHEYVKKIK